MTTCFVIYYNIDAELNGYYILDLMSRNDEQDI